MPLLKVHLYSNALSIYDSVHFLRKNVLDYCFKGMPEFAISSKDQRKICQQFCFFLMTIEYR